MGCIVTENVMYLPSGRIFLTRTDDNYLIESTEMRDVSIQGKIHSEVRTTNDPHIIWKHLVPFKDKWLLTVSTQKGCSFNCGFCDVAKLPFAGNLSVEDIQNQISAILCASPYVLQSDKVKIGFARMGEPACNLLNVIEAIKSLPQLAKEQDRDFKWLPCFNSILPRCSPCIEEILEVKEKDCAGYLHFQISCNSTDEEKRRELFGGAKVLTLKEIVDIVNKKSISTRTVTLNFIVMDGVEVDVLKLKRMGLSGDKFTVKLIPLNNTLAAEKSGLKTYANYSNYEKLEELKKKFEQEGVPVVIDAIAKCEEAGLCCGQLAQVFQS